MLKLIHNVAINILKSEGPKTYSCGAPDKTSKVNERRLKCVEKIADQKGNYENSLRNLQKALEHKVCEVKWYARQGQMHC